MINTFRIQLVKAIEKTLKSLKEDDIMALWQFSIKRWVATLRYGHI
jgi:hypothetical protein